MKEQLETVKWRRHDALGPCPAQGFADVNGDGKPDLWYASPGNTLYVRLLVGSGFGVAAAWASAIPWSGSGDWHGVGEDFNGDG